MEKTDKDYLIDHFQKECLGKYEVLDKDKLEKLEFGDIQTSYWKHSSNSERAKQLEGTIVSLLNYYIKDNYLILDSGINLTKINLDSENFKIEFKTIHLSYGTHYSLLVKNDVIESVVEFFPPFRKKYAFDYAEKFSKYIKNHLAKNDLI